jgi:hypothetical protein
MDCVRRPRPGGALVGVCQALSSRRTRDPGLDDRQFGTTVVADGTELYYLSQSKMPGTKPAEPIRPRRDRWVMAASVTVTASGLDVGRPERLFSADDYLRFSPLRSWDMGPDGRFLMARRASDEVVREAMDAFFPNHIRLIQNWASTLESGGR